jgi:hypothetical protein
MGVTQVSGTKPERKISSTDEPSLEQRKAEREKAKLEEEDEDEYDELEPMEHWANGCPPFQP